MELSRDSWLLERLRVNTCLYSLGEGWAARPPPRAKDTLRWGEAGVLLGVLSLSEQMPALLLEAAVEVAVVEAVVTGVGCCRATGLLITGRILPLVTTGLREAGSTGLLEGELPGRG